MTALQTPPESPADLVASVLDEEARRQAEQAERGNERIVVADDLLPGVGGEQVPLRAVLRGSAGGVSVIAVLFGLGLVDNLDTSAFAVLGPDIRESLGLSDAGLGVIGAISQLLVFVAAIPLGVLADRTRRTSLVGACTAVWAGFAILTGFVQSTWQLVVTRIFAGLGKANETPVQSSLLADAYPIEGRSRIYGIHRGATPVGLVLGPALAGGVAALAGGDDGWRWAFVVLALPAAILALIAFTLREPSRGRNEMLELLGEELPTDADELPIPLGAAFARLKKVQTFYFLLIGLGAFGLGIVTAPIYLNLILEDRFGLSAGERGVVGSLAYLGGVVGVILGGTAGDRLFRRAPERSMALTGVLIAGYGVFTPIAIWMPNPTLYTIVYAVAVGCLFAAFVPTNTVVAAVTPYRLRSMGFATVGLYLSLIGGLGGALLVGLLADAVGNRGALTIVVPLAALAGGALIAFGSRHVRTDIGLAAQDLLEERDERARVAAGGEVPMLQVRNLDFSYGPVQVLFDVGLDVRRGEVLALLGTNGAGKSTLLRAISGLSHADRGVVRLAGRTITYADPGTRVRLGIVQVPGGKTVFPSLSVEENLRARAYTLRRDRALVDRRIDKVVELFPVLGERMDQPAGTLSGGEQQMVGLATALLVDPELLLIDELSLGLAPVVVQQLLGVVEQLKAEGLTMVIVEQSVNVALSIADRAVFMEKGQVRFEGPAAELLERDDLVRAVFLGGAGG